MMQARIVQTRFPFVRHDRPILIQASDVLPHLWFNLFQFVSSFYEIIFALSRENLLYGAIGADESSGFTMSH